MARRPVFLPGPNREQLVLEDTVEFDWFPGLATSQKQRSILALHDAARSQLRVSSPLEISSKALEASGLRASAFNLQLSLRDGRRSTVECAYQGSKVFEKGGPFTDLYGLDSLRAKRDPRLQAAGPLRGFDLLGDEWGLEPITAFYDWLYLSALRVNDELGEEVMRFDAFTDIEFNPERSFSCQARSAAMFVALSRMGLLRDFLTDKQAFLNCYNGQGRLL